MRRTALLALAVGTAILSACNPFYSVEQSDVERGYRWISRGEHSRAIETFGRTLVNYPKSGVATLGMADALVEAGRHREAIPKYTEALELLTVTGVATVEPNSGVQQVVGDRTFSYQNQGLRFPHGLTAYIYFRRGSAYEAIVRREQSAPAMFRTLAVQDFVAAARSAPMWREPKERHQCLVSPGMLGCVQ